MTMRINHVTNNITSSVGDMLINGYAIGEKVVEHYDMTADGSNNLTAVDTTTTFEAGYSYRVVLRNVSSTATSALYIRLRNDAGTWMDGSTDYAYQGGVTNVSPASGNSSVMVTYYYTGFSGGGATAFYDLNIQLFSAMDTTRYTSTRVEGHAYSPSGEARSFAYGWANAVDGHDKMRLYLSAGYFDSGDLYVYRTKETS